MSKLSEIQRKLKAPKGQFNTFGKYKYRSCEDILEAIKPLLGDCTLQMSDEIVQLGTGGIIDTTTTEKNGTTIHSISPDVRYYVKATVTLYGDKDAIYSASAFAREPLSKKGVDSSQITGTASSYARKYALNGLFCIDDTKDADIMDNSVPPGTQPQTSPPALKILTVEEVQSAGFQTRLAKQPDFMTAIGVISRVYIAPLTAKVNDEINKHFNAKKEA